MSAFLLCDIGTVGGLLFLALLFLIACAGSVSITLRCISARWDEDMDRLRAQLRADRLFSGDDK